MKILAFAASLREESFNRKLLEYGLGFARKAGADVDVADFSEFVAPAYNGDVQNKSGIPPEIQDMAARIDAVDGIILASPEYNFSMPGVLKNTIDWISRVKPMPLRGKSALLLSASTGQVGGIRGLWQLRIPLEGLGVFVNPDMYTLPWAGKMFDDNGALIEEVRAERLRATVEAYLRVAKRIAEN